ncbi:tetratricopeptide repeat protein [Ferrimonas aestuarii]|uniref:Tetratricopeptide repeat-containing protein n=1 Tax=Ferrimonas aestuarii TaxID=2569539 RepID=A0A4U1BN40_9GAMM|nr:hypothetical protein [Ferrimonas aestuarii]TKB53006.1 hypothetical protein FCL42_15090 [Ferrimonas aestuarii]
MNLKINPWILWLNLSLISMALNASSLHQSMLHLYRGQFEQAQALLEMQPTIEGDWLYIQGRLALQQHHWQQAKTSLSTYLASGHDSVHRLEARYLFGLIRKHQDRPQLAQYLALHHYLEQGLPLEWQRGAHAFIKAYPQSELAKQVQLQQAQIWLEWFNQPQQAVEHYQRLISEFQGGEQELEARLGLAYAHLYLQQPLLGKTQINQIESQLASLVPSTLKRRVWRRRTQAAQQSMNPGNGQHPIRFGVGSQLNLDKPTGSGQNFRPIWNHLPKSDLPVQHLTLWITRHSDWGWLQPDLLKAASRAGYTPVIAFWYFGDEISPEFVDQHRQAYLDTLSQKLLPLIKDLPQAYLLLEPEFNKNGISDWAGWPKLMKTSFALIRQHAPNTKAALVLGDWQPLGQQQPLVDEVVAMGDFTASMLMISPHTELAHQSPDWSPWVRTLRLSQQLNKRFNKPYMLAYAALPSEPRWQQRQAIELEKLKRLLPALQHQQLFSINWFNATDNPQQQGWFAESEPYFGLFDIHHQPKAALRAFKHLGPITSASATVTDVSQSSHRLEIEFDSWQHWTLVDQQGRRHSGAGDALSLPLPIADLSGQTQLMFERSSALTLTLPKQQTHPNQARNSHHFSLVQWQQLRLPLVPNSGIEGIWLRLELTQPLDDGLLVGLSDDQGFERTARLIGYADANQTQFTAFVPLHELSYPWRKYQPGSGFIWHHRPSQSPSLLLMNQGTQSVIGKITAYGWF